MCNCSHNSSTADRVRDMNSFSSCAASLAVAGVKAAAAAAESLKPPLLVSAWDASLLKDLLL
jgi:hypothetical protein